MAVPVGNSRSEILAVQPTQNWHGQRLTDALDGAGIGASFCSDKWVRASL